jgi:hypothetical protein
MPSDFGLLVEKSYAIVARHHVWSPLVLAYKSARYLARSIAWRAQTPEQRFSEIYARQTWKRQGAPGSGDGSSLDYTQSFRGGLEALLAERRIGTLFDAPCGDMTWMRAVQLPAGTTHLGGDIVASLIEAHKQSFDPVIYQFRVFDITRDRFPKADLWLCRDCLFHLSYADIFAALRQFVHSEIPLALITCHTDVQRNWDIQTGEWRCLDLTKAPFHFPAPSFHIEDWVKGHPKRIVGLWTRKEIATALGAGADRERADREEPVPC